MGSPNSLSSSTESVRSLASSGDSSNSIKVNEGKDFGKKPSKKESKSSLARTLSEPVHKSEQQLHDVCRDGVTVTSGCNEETFDRNDEEKENWDLDEITCNDSNVMRESTDEHSSIDGWLKYCTCTCTCTYDYIIYMYCIAEHS